MINISKHTTCYPYSTKSNQTQWLVWRKKFNLVVDVLLKWYKKNWHFNKRNTFKQHWKKIVMIYFVSLKKAFEHSHKSESWMEPSLTFVFQESFERNFHCCIVICLLGMCGAKIWFCTLLKCTNFIKNDLSYVSTYYI